MSSEWRKYKLGDLGQVITGKTPKTSNTAHFGGDIPFVTPSDMDDRKIINSTLRYLSNTGASSVKNSIIPSGSVMVSCIGSDMGKCAVAGRKCVTNQQLNSVVVDKKRFCNDFVYYNLSNRKSELQHLAAGGSTLPILNKTKFSEIVIELPSLEKQQQISSILSTLDDRIALLRETNATLESIAQAIFKSWFIDFDPVKAKQQGVEPQGIDAVTAALFPDAFQDSKLGPIPAGWEVCALDEIAEYLNGLALQKYPPNGQDDLPVIKIAQLRKGDTVGANMASRKMKTEYIVQDGDVLFSWSGSLDVVIWCGGEGALNQHLFKASSTDYPKWLYYLWTKQHLADFQMIAASKATTMGHIQRHHLRDAKVVVPPMKHLRRFDDFFNPLLNNWITNSLRAKSLASIRDALLPRLISGRLRLPEAEAMAGEAGL